MKIRTALMWSTLTIGSILGPAAVVHAQDTTLWYRGYFDGEVTIKSGSHPGFYYRPSRPTTYPLNEAQYSAQLPCDVCGYHHKAGGYSRQLGRVCSGNGSHLDDDLVYVPTPYQLPGQYWHEKQNHYTWRTPMNIGWPYVKYRQRTEPSGSVPMGRRLDHRLNRR